ncbi:MAG: aspartate aminotransferase family protein [Oscillospiraceae bacterium]|nr:aspartate aminotransferase family protein [Oscillospiraceae bacterium]
MNNSEVIRLTDENIMQTYSRFPVAVKEGRGATLYDFEDGRYIDFTSGIGVCSVGYGNEKWVEAVSAQAAALQHVSNLYYTEPAALLAKRLKERTGMSRVFFSNSGAEANEGAVKLGRKYSFDKYGEGRSTVVTLIQSFHGRTVTTLAATGQDVFHNYFFPFTEGFRYTPANDIKALDEALTGDVCALMIELIQGEGGVLPLDKAFVDAAARLCAERDILLITDEVQTGVGRTGKLFCFQQYGVMPDVCSFAKGIAGGLPFGGIMASAKCADVLGPGTHASTFGGNPVCAAGALAVLDILSDEELKRVSEKGEYIRAGIAKMNAHCVTGVRGMGMMTGVGVNVSHKEIASKCAENGLLVLTAGKDMVRLLPPLTISYEEIDEGLAILRGVLERA